MGFYIRTKLQVLLYFVILSISPFTFLSGQCSMVVSSTSGYDVNIIIEPVNIVAPSSCPGGYNFNVDLDYDISFTGTNIPSSLWTLQGTLDCGSHTNMFFPLPNNGGIGTTTSNANPYRSVADCQTATPESLECDAINLTINGPGITTSSHTCVVSYSSALLPVELISFSGKSTSIGVGLQWETGSELDNDYFLLQRSDDGIIWSDIKKIPGMGTTFIKNRYSYIDRAPLSGTAFYRLKQTDFDGQFELSNVVSIKHKNVDQVTLFPNPANEKITITQLKSNEEIIVLNSYGKVVNLENQINIISEEIAEIDITNLPAGFYFLKTRKETLKFTKI